MQKFPRLIYETNNYTGSDGCLDQIYVMAYTGTSNNAGSSHSHNFEVVAASQTRLIALPGHYTRQQGDIWKLDVVEDLGFVTGTCVR